MKCTGSFKDFLIDYFSEKTVVTLTLNEDVRQEYERLRDKDKLSIEIKQHRERRSLNANSYFHVLVEKLANVLKTSKPYMKNLLLQKYGQYAMENDNIVHFIIREDVDVSEREDIHLAPTPAVKTLDDGKLYRVYRLIRGSHTYNTYEMSVLIDGTVQDAKEQGIETATPDELRRMKEQWGVDVG